MELTTEATTPSETTASCESATLVATRNPSATSNPSEVNNAADAGNPSDASSPSDAGRDSNTNNSSDVSSATETADAVDTQTEIVADDELSLPEPRSFAQTGALFACLATVPFVLLWSWSFSALMGQSFWHVLPIGVGAGVMFGVMFGLTMGYFFQGVAVAIEVNGKRDFERRVNAAMTKIGYKADIQAENCFVFKPTVRVGLAAGTLWVGVEGEQGVVVGPKIYVNRVVKQLDPHAAWR